MSGFGFGYGFHRTGGFKFDGSAQAYFDAVPDAFSDARKVIINTLISTLKFDNNWNKLDRLWLFANTTTGNAVIDIKNLSSATLVNAPTFTADQGYTGNGTTSYVNSNFNPVSASYNYTLNSASLGVYNRTAGAESSHVIGHSSGSDFAQITIYFTDTNSYSRVNSATVLTSADTDALGLYGAVRTSSTAVALHKNGSSIGSGSITSTTLIDYPMFILARNNAGTPASLSTRQLSIGFIGSGAINQATFYTAIQAYMTSLGTQV